MRKYIQYVSTYVRSSGELDLPKYQYLLGPVCKLIGACRRYRKKYVVCSRRAKVLMRKCQEWYQMS